MIAALIFLRFSIVAISLPGLANSVVAIRYRLVVSVILSIFAATVMVDLLEQLPPIDFRIVLSEAVVGFVIALSIRSIIFCLQILGAFIAQLISLSQILGPSVAAEAQSTISNFLVVGGITLILSLGFLEVILAAIIGSYDIYPFGANLDSFVALDLILFSFKTMSQLVLQLAAPFVLLALYYNATLAIVNRAMPQLLVSFIGVPAILLISIALLAISVQPILSMWAQASFDLIGKVGW